MTVSLQIKRKEFDMIKAGTKKTEWRSPSLFNKQKLFFQNKDIGKWDARTDITQIEFINGYRTDREKLIVECLGIKMYKFVRDIDIPEDNFKALEGQFAIAITLGIIINSQSNEEPTAP